MAQFSQKRVRTFARLFHCQCRDRGRFSGTARTVFSYSALPSFLAWRLLPYGLSVTRRRIGEAFAYDSLYGARSSLHVIYAEPNAIAIAEIKFRQIAVQMLLTAMLVDAFHAALKNRIVTFDCIGVDVAITDVFVGAVLDGVVAGKPSPMFS